MSARADAQCAIILRPFATLLCHIEWRVVLHGGLGRPLGLEEVLLEPLELLIEFAPLVGELPQPVRLAGEQQVPNGSLFDQVHRPKPLPTLFGGHVGVFGPEEDDRRRGDPFDVK